MTLPLYDYSSKTVLITGAATGIGRATAIAFAASGAHVVAGVLPGQVTAFEDEMKTLNAPAYRVKALDVRDEASVKAFVHYAASQFSGIDIAVNNAGIEGPFGPLHELDASDFDNLLATNLRGVWLSLKYELQHMVPRKAGVIINLASTAGVQAIPMVAVYSATKHGIVGLTRGAALEQAANGIRVNAVAPGPVDTGLLSRMISGQVPQEVIAGSVPMKRISRPAEIAQAILWLASDASGYVTGETLMVDGGLVQA